MTQAQPAGTPDNGQSSLVGARIGVFICHCGGNISDVVDVKRVAEEIGKLPNVVLCHHPYVHVFGSRAGDDRAQDQGAGPQPHRRGGLLPQPA